MTNHQKAFFLAFGAAASWAVSIVLNKFLFLGGADPAQVALLCEFVALPFWASILLKNRAAALQTPKKEVLKMLIIGIISTIGITYLETLALKNTTVTNYSFLIRSVLLFTFLFAHVFLKEKLNRSKMLLGAIIISGTYLLVVNGRSLHLNLGDIFTLGEAATIAFINNILLKKMVSRLNPDIVSAGTYIFGLSTMGIIALPTFNWHNLPAIWLILIISLFGQMIGLLRNRAYQYATSSFTSMIFSFTPVLATAGSVLFLKESISPIQLIGGGIIISASILAYKLRI